MSKSRYLSLLKQLKKILNQEELNGAFENIERAVAGHQWPGKLAFTGLAGDLFPLPLEVQNLEANHYILFSDGACRGNPGPGSWGSIGQDHEGRTIFELSGVDVNTTNNRMELEGAIQALEALIHHLIDELITSKAQVHLYSDSRYVVDGMTSWIKGWKAKGWKKSDGKVPENIEFWKRIDTLTKAFSGVKFYWVRGHNGHPQNEYCDKLANDALDQSGF